MIKRYVISLFKGSPWVIGTTILMVVLAKQYIKYATPMYQSTAKIKIDDGSIGLANTNLYKDFDVFSSTNKVLTEIEVLKSTNLIQKTLTKLDFGIEYYRVGKVKTSELYHESPFLIIPQDSVIDLAEEVIYLSIKGNKLIINKHINALFGEEVRIKNTSLIILKNEHLLHTKSETDVDGEYMFVVRDKLKLARSIKSELDITAVDKDISVVRISLKNRVPLKSSEFVNMHMQTYVEDYIENRSQAAKKSIVFLDHQIEEVSSKLNKEETNLEEYKLNNNIINTRQETETGLKKIAQLKIQLANLQLKKNMLDSLDKYVNSSQKDFLSLAPHVDVSDDMMYFELMNQIQKLRAKRKELLIDYTINSDKVLTLDSKLNDLVDYLKESIKNSKANLVSQYKQLEATIIKAEEEYKNTPTIEKKVSSLEREFNQTQKLYNFLSEKKSEAALAKSATHSFHQILEFAYPPSKPVSPNKTLIVFMLGFLGALIGVGLAYLIVFIFGKKINSLSDLEKNFEGRINRIINNELMPWVTKLLLKGNVNKHHIMAVSSLVKKSNFGYDVADAFMAIGWKTLIMDLHPQNEIASQANFIEDILSQSEKSDLKLQLGNNLLTTKLSHQQLGVLTNDSKFTTFLKRLKNEVDLVIINIPPILDHIDSVKIGALSDEILIHLKRGKTSVSFCDELNMLMSEYNLKNVSINLSV